MHLTISPNGIELPILTITRATHSYIYTCMYATHSFIQHTCNENLLCEVTNNTLVNKTDIISTFMEPTDSYHDIHHKPSLYNVPKPPFHILTSQPLIPTSSHASNIP